MKISIACEESSHPSTVQNSVVRENDSIVPWFYFVFPVMVAQYKIIERKDISTCQGKVA